MTPVLDSLVKILSEIQSIKSISNFEYINKIKQKKLDLLYFVLNKFDFNKLYFELLNSNNSLSRDLIYYKILKYKIFEYTPFKFIIKLGNTSKDLLYLKELNYLTTAPLYTNIYYENYDEFDIDKLLDYLISYWQERDSFKHYLKEFHQVRANTKNDDLLKNKEFIYLLYLFITRDYESTEIKGSRYYSDRNLVPIILTRTYNNFSNKTIIFSKSLRNNYFLIDTDLTD